MGGPGCDDFDFPWENDVKVKQIEPKLHVWLLWQNDGVLSVHSKESDAEGELLRVVSKLQKQGNSMSIDSVHRAHCPYKMIFLTIVPMELR